MKKQAKYTGGTNKRIVSIRVLDRGAMCSTTRIYRIDQFKLYGKLLNYPECCIEHFRTGGSWVTNGGISHHGFCPCPEHAKEPYEVLTKLIGRDLKVGPLEFWMFTSIVEREKTWATCYEKGRQLYAVVGKEDFFDECWESAKLDNSTD